MPTELYLKMIDFYAYLPSPHHTHTQKHPWEHFSRLKEIKKTQQPEKRKGMAIFVSIGLVLIFYT